MKRMIPLVLTMMICGAIPVVAQDGGEAAEETPLWTGSLGLSWVATSGNSDTSTGGLDVALDRRPQPWGLALVARATRAEDSNLVTAENYLVSGRAIRALDERWEVFGGLQWSRDRFAGFNSQTVASVGATYTAVKRDRHLLTFDGGLTYTWEDRVPPIADVDFAGALLGLGWEWKLSDSAALTERLMFLPNLDSSSDWRLTSMTALTADVNTWLALRLGLEVRHRNEPIGDADGTDTTSTASVVFKL